MKLQEEYGIPARMLQKMMTGKDLQELQVFRIDNPHWSDVLLDAMAYLTWWVYAVNTKDVKLEPSEFRVKYGEKHKQSQEQMEFNARQWVIAHGGKIIDNVNNSDTSNETNG